MQDTDLLFEGLLLLMKASEAKKGIIAVNPERTNLIALLNKFVKTYADEGIEIKAVCDIFTLCSEGILVTSSLSAIEFARFFKSGLPMHERIVTLSGEGVKKPKNVRVRIGAILEEAVKEIGGYAEDLDPKSSRLIAGGPFKGSSIISDELSILSGTDAFLYLTNTEKEAMAMPCIHCGICIDYCPVGIQPIQIAMAHKVRDTDLLKKLGTDRCIKCGHCSSVCPSFIELSAAVTKAKNFLESVRK